MTKWTVSVIQDGEDLVLPFPDELLEHTGWQPGDVLEWVDLKDGSFQLVKKIVPKSWTPEEEEAWKELERKQQARNG